jgi:hypothetical protein
VSAGARAVHPCRESNEPQDRQALVGVQHPPPPPKKIKSHTHTHTPHPPKKITHTQATDSKTGIYNFSPLFALSNEQRRRKLYGPVMWA